MIDLIPFFFTFYILSAFVGVRHVNCQAFPWLREQVMQIGQGISALALLSYN
jgi:hypothetical protein